MGWINGFFEGVGDATVYVAKQELANKAAREQDEANFLRERNLAELKNGWDDKRVGREHGFRMDEAGFTAKTQAEQKEADRKAEAEQKRLDRESSERVAGMRGSRSGSKPVKIGEDDIGNPIYGVYDEDAGEIVPIDVSGKGGATDPNADLTQAEIERARVELNTSDGKDKANDWVPGNEPSEDQIKARAYENRKGGKSANAVAPTAESPESAKSPQKALNVGDVVNGYEYLGGDRNSDKSWRASGSTEKAQKPAMRVAPEAAQKSGLVGAIAAAKDARTEFDRQSMVWSKWRNTTNPAATKAEAKRWLDENIGSLTGEQRKQADAILASFGAAK